ncbi:hypothetical protein [Flavobacterium restrictum]|uniref:Immunity protein 30 domain-containing protein n=1 Tax=Flavobacterium restrictum TaxID=2594428 RepID=A0A553DT25_9FLAO|nr:hypothetical protein [Flavobacterium restrictum]TRX35948.1 hypothetical protein FNW21_14095 [Flavobacterium restrictum]
MEDFNKLKERVVDSKKQSVSELIEFINATNNHESRRELIFTLIYNFKDDRIIATLVNLIKREDLKHYNGSIIYACEEYSSEECKPYLEMFVDIVIDGDYEASWGSASLILNFPAPYDVWETELLDKLLAKLKSAMNDDENGNKEFIEAVLKAFEEN